MGEISRRDALKRGAALGAGVLWATPAVQVVSMMKSAAAATSPPPPDAKYFAVKIEDGGKCEDIWDQVGRDTNPNAAKGKCTTPNASEFAVIPGGCDKVRGADAPDDDKTPWKVRLRDGCVLVKATVKAAKDCQPIPYSQDGNTYVFRNPAPNGKGISHLELIICCRPT